MTIQGKQPLLVDDVAKALEAYASGDFDPAMRMLQAPPVDRKSIEVVSYPGRVRPISFAIAPELLVPPRMNITGLCRSWCTKMAIEREWQRYLFMYGLPDLRKPAKPPQPKWGQPGRGRKRKARQAARHREREIQRLLAEVRKLADGAVVLPVAVPR